MAEDYTKFGEDAMPERRYAVQLTEMQREQEQQPHAVSAVADEHAILPERCEYIGKGPDGTEGGELLCSGRKLSAEASSSSLSETLQSSIEERTHNVQEDGDSSGTRVQRPLPAILGESAMQAARCVRTLRKTQGLPWAISLLCAGAIATALLWLLLPAQFRACECLHQVQCNNGESCMLARDPGGTFTIVEAATSTEASVFARNASAPCWVTRNGYAYDKDPRRFIYLPLVIFGGIAFIILFVTAYCLRSAMRCAHCQCGETAKRIALAFTVPLALLASCVSIALGAASSAAVCLQFEQPELFPQRTEISRVITDSGPFELDDVSVWTQFPASCYVRGPIASLWSGLDAAVLCGLAWLYTMVVIAVCNFLNNVAEAAPLPTDDSDVPSSADASSSPTHFAVLESNDVAGTRASSFLPPRIVATID